MKRARQGCSPYPAHLPHKFDLNKELTDMLHINSQSGKAAVSRCINNQSPWIELKAHHLFNNELSIARDASVHHTWEPMPFFTWVDANGAENIMLNALAQCCPAFPAVGYRDAPFVYLSPPPSGSINAVAYIVIGRDSNGNLRAVGCNYESMHRSKQPSADFFGGFDLLTRKDDKAEYIKAEVCSRMTSDDVRRLDQMQYESRKYGVIPVVMVALDQKSGPHFAIDTAVIKPWGSCDYAYEFAGEIL